MSNSTFVLDEFVEYAVATMTFMALGETLSRGELIRVMLLHDKLDGVGKRLLDLVAFISAMAVGSLGVWHIGKSIIRNYVRGTIGASIAEVPQWLPQAMILAGLIVFVLQAAAYGDLSFSVIWDSLVAAVPTACMICSILVAASFLSTAMGFLHNPQDVARFIGELQLSPLGLLGVLALFYILLGLLLDGISITVMTLPITLPLIVAAGIDPVWFGVFLVIMVELGQMTPPVGFNLFIIQGMSGVPVLRVAAASMPFFLLMCLAVLILIMFPEIALWLPEQFY